MWQEIVGWLRGSVQTKSPQSPEEFEKTLEGRVETLEKRADHLERVAILRDRAAEANVRIKEVTPKGQYLRWVVLGVGVFILFLIVKSCF